MIPVFVRRYFSADQRRWPLALKLASRLNDFGVKMVALSRELMNAIYADDRGLNDRDPVVRLRDLNAAINDTLRRQAQEYKSYTYFNGYPYQGLGLLNVFGDRLADPRFDEYELRKFISEKDNILDIGCSCGFIALMAAYRTGCRAHGIDINPYMIEIGRLCADHLNVGSLVSLEAVRIQEYTAKEPFTVVLSFATHWTDDENYRVSIRDHMQRMHSYLAPGGLLLFETHAADPGQAEFYAAMETVRDLFSWDGVFKKTESGLREFYVMRKI
ncbi:class I SAM-dependent methyltransferase [Bosea sp. UC22_33]|uniref:class I SAM-dependent methyltransferase n=1 Tax=Bosea sp. UC22_33 TaxID=3350165 RepID=UPI00367273D0